VTHEVPPAAAGGAAHRLRAQGLWANRNYTLLLSGQTISQVGNALFPLAVYWWTFSLTGSSTDLGYVATVEGLTAMAGVFAGVLVDRWDRRRTMIWADVTRLALTGVLGLAALFGQLSFASILVFVLLLGLVQNLFSPAQSALLPRVVEPDDLDAALGLNQGASASAGLIGTSLGGALLGLVGAASLMLLDSASFIVSAVSVGLLRLPRSATQPHPDTVDESRRSQGYLRELLEGLSFLWSRPLFRHLVPIAVIMNLAFMPLNVLAVAWVRGVLGGSALDYGLFEACGVGGIILGSVLVRPLTRRFSPRQVILGALALITAAYVALSQLPFLIPDLLLLLCLGLPMGVVNPMLQGIFRRAVPHHLLGRAAGVMGSLVLLASPLGALLAGLGAGLGPLRIVFLAGGLAMFGALVLAYGLPRAYGQHPPELG